MIDTIIKGNGTEDKTRWELFFKHRVYPYLNMKTTISNVDKEDYLDALQNVIVNGGYEGNAFTLLNTLGLISKKMFIPWHTNKYYPQITVDNFRGMDIKDFLELEDVQRCISYYGYDLIIMAPITQETTGKKINKKTKAKTESEFTEEDLF